MKEKPHILFLTHYFPPEVNAPANRTYEHCRYWVSKGNTKVTVITNFPHHPDGKIFPGYKNKLIQKEIIDGINVVRLWTFITPNEGFFLRTLNYIVYMIGAVVFSVLSRIKFDLVIATTPQFYCGLAGKYVSKIRRKPLILELRDLWPESIIAVGLLKNRFIIKTLERIELNLYKASTKIVSVTRSFKKNLINRGVPEEKIEVLFNGVSEDIFLNGKDIGDKILKEYISEGFIVGYIGTIGLAHSIITLVEAAELLRETNIRFVIVGSGAERFKLEKVIELKKLTNIKIFPIQTKDQIPGIIDRLDLFCVHLKNEPLFKTVIPSKLFEGMIMRKPILVGVNGESREIVEEANCGVYFIPENENDLKEKILSLQNDKNKLKELGENGYRFVLKNFNREQIAGEYFRIIKGVTE